MKRRKLQSDVLVPLVHDDPQPERALNKPAIVDHCAPRQLIGFVTCADYSFTQGERERVTVSNFAAHCCGIGYIPLIALLRLPCSLVVSYRNATGRLHRDAKLNVITNLL